MPLISNGVMRSYLAASIRNKGWDRLTQLRIKADLKNHINSLGFENNLFTGGLIVRSEGAGQFGHNTVVFFPETIDPLKSYSSDRKLPDPNYGLHTICSTFHQIGTRSYFCAPVIHQANEPQSIQWSSIQLGLPTQQNYMPFPGNMAGFNRRLRRYNFLRHGEDMAQLPQASLPEEFSKEHLRVTFQSEFMSEIADVDGILWGHQHTYPLEIKEKTPANDPRLGNYFGLDLGPFVKLAFYAAKRGNLHSLFIVREIDAPDTRNLVNWWFITFEQMALFASWIPIGGGTNMGGGGSTTVKIPKSEFRQLNLQALQSL